MCFIDYFKVNMDTYPSPSIPNYLCFLVELNFTGVVLVGYFDL